MVKLNRFAHTKEANVPDWVTDTYCALYGVDWWLLP